MRPEVTTALATLEAHRAEMGHRRIVDLFDEDKQRFAKFSARLDDLLFDYSKHAITETTMAHLLTLARVADVEGKRSALFAGHHVNNTEDRAAHHMALRDMSGNATMIDGQNVTGEIGRVRKAFLNFAMQVRDGTIRGARGAPFADVVNIGIGGSDLGPAMAARALSPYRGSGPRVHFVSNVDGADLADTLKSLNPATTLFIISSKTFTTQETMKNAQSARMYIVKQLGEKAIPDHFAAVSTKLDLVAKFGIKKERVFGFWDWVGGRYSMDSAIGLSTMIAVGPDGFRELLDGFHDMDEHFKSTPLEKNLPVIMGLIGLWNNQFLGADVLAVLPYCQYLDRFSAYLQQLEMESNGKHVTRDGQHVKWETCPVVWGQPGTNGQHAFYQMIHQGTKLVPCDFIAFAEPLHDIGTHQDTLTANVLAQAEALAFGKTTAEIVAEGVPQWLAIQKTMEGNRPSNTILCKKLSPRMLGRLIAFYEHKVFTQGTIWGVNSFDQWGVELGKVLAKRIIPELSGAPAKLAHDSSTNQLIETYRSWRGR